MAHGENGPHPKPKAPNLNTYQVKSGRMQRENGRVINVADRVDTVTRETRVGAVNISPTPTLLQVEAEPLIDRHTLMVINDSSLLFYVSVDEGVEFGTFNPIIVFSGESIIFSIDADTPKEFYAVTEQLETTIRIVEVN